MSETPETARDFEYFKYRCSLIEINLESVPYAEMTALESKVGEVSIVADEAGTTTSLAKDSATTGVRTVIAGTSGMDNMYEMNKVVSEIEKLVPKGSTVRACMYHGDMYSLYMKYEIQ
jgi:hypothetical protein